jgi:hypothetical protein
MKTLIKIHALIFAAILLIGCATFAIPSGLKTEEIRDKKNFGKFYPVTLWKQVWR